MCWKLAEVRALSNDYIYLEISSVFYACVIVCLNMCICLMWCNMNYEHGCFVIYSRDENLFENMLYSTHVWVVVVNFIWLYNMKCWCMYMIEYLVVHDVYLSYIWFCEIYVLTCGVITYACMICKVLHEHIWLCMSVGDCTGCVGWRLPYIW